MPTLHVHVDESGELNFSPAGSRYYIFTAAWTYDPVPLAAELTNLRYSLIKTGHGSNLSGFHACEDPAPLRERVITAMLKHRDWNFASIVVDKPKVNPSVRDPETFYPKFLSMVLRFVFRGRIQGGTGQILIYTDTLPFTRKRAVAVATTIKKACRADLPPTISFEICNHSRDSNPWIQLTDYCCWSVCRKWEHGDLHSYDLLKARLAAREIEPMSRGDGTIYYERVERTVTKLSPFTV